MAKRQLKPWHHQVTTVLAVITLLFVIGYFAQSFRTFFLTDHDPVLVAIERIQEKVGEKTGEATEESAGDAAEEKPQEQ